MHAVGNHDPYDFFKQPFHTFHRPVFGHGYRHRWCPTVVVQECVQDGLKPIYLMEVLPGLIDKNESILSSGKEAPAEWDMLSNLIGGSLLG